MSNENKVINIADHLGMQDEPQQHPEVPVPPEVSEDPIMDSPKDEAGDRADTEEDVKVLEDRSDVTEEITIQKMEAMMQTMADSLKVIQQIWLEQARDLGLTPDNMKSLYALNASHCTTPPDDLTDEEKEQWDYWNGLNTVEWEDLEPIFGKSHKCYGVDISQTRDRLKTACKDHENYVYMMTEYRAVHDGYLRLIEEEEEAEIQSLRDQLKELPEGDERAAAMQASIDQYYYIKYLGWIAEPLPEEDLGRILYCMQNADKIDYYMQRTIAKLKQMGVSPKFLPEISKFEDRFLGEEYKTNSQVLLAFFCHFMTFADISEPVKDIVDNTKRAANLDRTMAVCFVHGLDGLIRKTCTADMGEAIMNNIIALEDQFLGKTPQPKE